MNVEFESFAAIERPVNEFQQYMGASTMLVNFLVLVVFLKDNRLRGRHLFIALAVGDFLEGTYFAYAGYARLKEMDTDAYYDLLSPHDCAMKFYAIFQFIGVQLPNFASLMISIERVLAVTIPFWYRAKFTKLHRFGLLLITLLICTVSVIIYFLTVLPLTEKVYAWGNCALTYASNPMYNTAHQISVVVIQIAAFSLSAFAFAYARKKSRAVTAMRKEAQKVKSILAVSFISVILVTSPQIYLFVLNDIIGIDIINSYVLFTFTLLPCFNSFSNFFVYMWLTAEFRSGVGKIFSYCRCRKAVTPINGVTAAAIVVAPPSPLK